MTSKVEGSGSSRGGGGWGGWFPAPLPSPDWAPLVILHLRRAQPSGKWFNPLFISTSISAFHWGFGSTRPSHVSHPDPTSPRQHKLELFNDGFRRRHKLFFKFFLLPTRIYMQDLLPTLSRELQRRESFKKKPGLGCLMFFSCHRNGCERVSLIIVCTHDCVCCARGSCFITFNNEHLSGFTHIFNHATLKFPRNRRPARLRSEPFHRMEVNVLHSEQLK